MKSLLGADSTESEIEKLRHDNGQLNGVVQQLRDDNIQLNDDIQSLRDTLAATAEAKATLEQKLKFFEEQLLLSRRHRYGTSSEQSPDQINLFNEVESEASPNMEEPVEEQIVIRRVRKKPAVSRETYRDDLPTEVIDHPTSKDQEICPECNSKLHPFGHREQREILYVPASVKILVHRYPVCLCPNCKKDDLDTIVEPVLPSSLLPKSMASSTVIANIISQKFMMGLPLYRQEGQWEQLGINLSRQTQSNWLLAISKLYIEPMCSRMRWHLLKRDILYADETTLQVLKEPGRSAESTSYMWLYRTAMPSPIVLYDYKTTRASKHPSAFLSGFKGFLHADGYAAYHSLNEVTVIGCWSHARRKYDEALKVLPAAQRTSDLASSKGLDFCNQLFDIERELKTETSERRYEERLKRSVPILAAYNDWLKRIRPQAAPKSLLGKAVTYSLNQWEYLTNFLKDGRLELDNNLSERSIKNFVIGRKGWLFSNTPKGAESSAALYSLVVTAKENGLKVEPYLVWLLNQMPNIDIRDGNALDDLMPWSATVPNDIKM